MSRTASGRVLLAWHQMVASMRCSPSGTIRHGVFPWRICHAKQVPARLRGASSVPTTHRESVRLSCATCYPIQCWDRASLFADKCWECLVRWVLTPTLWQVKPLLPLIQLHDVLTFWDSVRWAIPRWRLLVTSTSDTAGYTEICNWTASQSHASCVWLVRPVIAMAGIQFTYARSNCLTLDRYAP